MLVKFTRRERNIQTAPLGCPLGDYSGLRGGGKPDSAEFTETPRHRRRHGAHGRTDEPVNKRIGNAGIAGQGPSVREA